MNRKGLIVVISAPSGGGKTTILRRVLASGEPDFRYSVSVTTRKRRPGEVDGRDYHFVSLQEFERMRGNGEFVEWAEVHGNYYGTPKAPIMKWLDQGKIVLTDLDVHGGLQVKEYFGDQAVLVFVMPPSLESLRDRLKSRNTESDAEIEHRLSRYPDEIEKAHHYDHQIINEDLGETTSKVLEIIKNHSHSLSGGFLND